MPDIREALREFNPWWTGEFELDYKERELYEKIKKFMDQPQIIGLTGLRRTGKTTLMLKVAKDSIEDGKDPKNILYFSFDEFQNTEIRKIIKNYEEITEKDFNDSETLLLLDEIQKLDNWANQLKTIYDTSKEKTKIIISGSESLFIRAESKENLAGRIYEFKLKTLSFREYLNFKDVEYKPTGVHQDKIERLFREYTKTLGFPELVGVRDKEIIKKYIEENIVEKVIYKDLATLVKTRDVAKLESILNIIMENPGQIIKKKDLANELNISRQTLSNYLSYLEKSFLIKKLYNYSRNQRKVERKLKKYYPAVLSTNLLFKQDSLSRSKVFEWLLATKLDPDFFWRDQYKNEVDFVLTKKGDKEKFLPVEAKYGKISMKGIERFMDRFDKEKGIILTKTREDEIKKKNKRIQLQPAFKYLLED